MLINCMIAASGLLFLAIRVLAQAPSGFTESSIQGFNYKCNGCDWTGLCSSASEQSPINVLEYQSTCDQSHTFKYQVQNLSSFVTVFETAGPVVYSNFMEFYLKDLAGEFIGLDSTHVKFRLPSEHQINGASFDVEMQISGHIKEEYSASMTNATLSVLFSRIPSQARVFSSDPSYEPTHLFSGGFNPFSPGNFTYNFSQFFLNEITSPAYYYYEGSSSEPPCSPHMWVLFKQSLYISQNDYSKLAGVFGKDKQFVGTGSNARSLQLKGYRVVIKGAVDCSTYFGYIVAFAFLFILLVYFIFKLL